MSPRASTSRLANSVAGEICRAFDQSHHEFREITRRASQRFCERDWRGIHDDSVARLEVYQTAVDRLVASVREMLEDRVRSRLVWVSIKAVFSGLIHDHDDWEIVETFFNSVTRRIFDTVGVDEEIEFVHSDYESPPCPARHPAYRTFDARDSLAKAIRAALEACDLPLGDAELERQSAAAASCIERRLERLGLQRVGERIEVLESVFYRGEYAYLIGRLVGPAPALPLVLCLRNGEQGIYIDAVLTNESDVSLLFSFARSYFHVDTDRPFDITQFIKSIIPGKPRSEIYSSIGYKKHGKTELYRHALRHLAGTSDKYQLAEGQRGMVMVVFTMPSYPVVFKIIKDQFDYPKQTTRQAVIECYRLVFKHDRAGRLIDAQEYQYLTLDRRRFDDKLLEELLAVAAQTVSIMGDRVVIKHCYAERRVTPLNVYLEEVDEQAARWAVVDYGQTIKDLAYTNIFPGDLLLKNFGVTRRRRLVFYDYDEVCLLTDCTFRQLPDSDDYDEQIAAEPWFAVGKQDVFPEEFGYFLGLVPSLRSVFIEHHADLLTVEFWLGVQQRLRSGEAIHVPPYGEEVRLQASDGPAPRGLVQR
jgi:isocitrate dehydrogenase kinase/phosphatase